jgi:hypothetical protein
MVLMVVLARTVLMLFLSLTQYQETGLMVVRVEMDYQEETDSAVFLALTDATALMVETG